MESVSTGISKTPDLSSPLATPESAAASPEEISNFNPDSPAETADTTSLEPEEDTVNSETAITDFWNSSLTRSP